MQGYEVAYTVLQHTGFSTILFDTNMYEQEMGETVSLGKSLACALMACKELLLLSAGVHDVSVRVICLRKNSSLE